MVLNGRVATALLSLAIAACASSPVPLVALPPASMPTAPEGSSENPGPTVLLRPITIPGYLDNFPVVIERKGNSLFVSDKAEWAERLSDAVARVLRDALSQRLGASRVLLASDPRLPDAYLSIEFLALDPQQGALSLDARWAFSCTGGGSGTAGRTRFQVPLESATAGAVAAATADAVTRLADVLATQVRCDRGK